MYSKHYCFKRVLYIDDHQGTYKKIQNTFSKSFSKHCFKTLSQNTVSKHSSDAPRGGNLLKIFKTLLFSKQFVKTLFQNTFSNHYLKTLFQNTLVVYPGGEKLLKIFKTLFQNRFSKHCFKTLSQNTVSKHSN